MRHRTDAVLADLGRGQAIFDTDYVGFGHDASGFGGGARGAPRYAVLAWSR
jgi:hypothetical protein